MQSMINDVCFGHKLMKKNNLYHEFANPAVEKYYITVNFTVMQFTILISSSKWIFPEILKTSRW